MDKLSPETKELFQLNQLAAHHSYVTPGEVVPHFFSLGSYYLTKDTKVRGFINACHCGGFKLVSERSKTNFIRCGLHGCLYDLVGCALNAPHSLEERDLVDIGGFSFVLESLRWNKKKVVDLFDDLFDPIYRTVDRCWSSAGMSDDSAEFKFAQENVTFMSCDWLDIAEVLVEKTCFLSQRNPGLGDFVDLSPAGLFQVHQEQEYSLITHTINPVAAKFIKLSPQEKLLYAHPVKSLAWINFKEELAKLQSEIPFVMKRAVLYPGMFIDMLPYAMIVNQLVPISPKMTAVYTQFFFTVTESGYQEALLNAYAETLHENHILAELLAAGRSATGWKDRTPLDHTSGMGRLNAWIKRNL